MKISNQKLLDAFLKITFATSFVLGVKGNSGCYILFLILLVVHVLGITLIAIDSQDKQRLYTQGRNWPLSVTLLFDFALLIAIFYVGWIFCGVLMLYTFIIEAYVYDVEGTWV